MKKQIERVVAALSFPVIILGSMTASIALMARGVGPLCGTDSLELNSSFV